MSYFSRQTREDIIQAAIDELRFIYGLDIRHDTLDRVQDYLSEKEIMGWVHLSCRFAKTFFPNEAKRFVDDMPFNNYTYEERLRLLGERLVEL